MQAKVIAVVMSDGETHSDRSATVLVRDANGQISLRTVNPDTPMGREAMRTGCFRRGKAIIDPVSRQMLGYEMELVPDALAS